MATLVTESGPLYFTVVAHLAREASVAAVRLKMRASVQGRKQN